MEYARKGDVLNYFIKKAKVEKKQIKESQIWTICKSVGQGLAILHKKNIVHKDIKPQNLLVMDDETIKVRFVRFKSPSFFSSFISYGPNSNNVTDKNVVYFNDADWRYGNFSFSSSLGK